MERSNPPPETEDGLVVGQEPVVRRPLAERLSRSVSPGTREPQAGPASGLSNSAPRKPILVDGETVGAVEPNMAATGRGEVVDDQPGSESVARAEGAARNRGGPVHSCRSNYESQAGKAAQRQEAWPEGGLGVGSDHSTQRQGASPEAEEGTDKLTQSAQATSPVRVTEHDWQTFLRAIAEKAKREPNHRFGDLYRWLNQDVLRLCFYCLRKDAASGVDGVTFQAYEKNLEANLTDLVGRLKRKAYRARLVRRKYIPKGNGKLRPLGIPALEDKLLQMAVTQLLLAIYEVDFLPCSYGYRPGLGPHDAIKALTDELQWRGHHFVVEADIKGFFDHLQHEQLLQMVARRVQDGALLNLIRKWLRAGILETDGQVIHPQTGTPQGGVISPVLANLYLHYVLDLWFAAEVQPKMRGRSRLFRFADDYVACLEYRHEAEAFEKAMKERLAQFGLEVAAEKTKTLRFGRNGGDYNGRFDFLGFEFYWGKNRKGKPWVQRRTATKKWRASVQRMKQWIKEQRHQTRDWLMKVLAAKLRGTWNYYGLIGNYPRMRSFYHATRRALLQWLNRRSQRPRVTWLALERMLTRFRVPPPGIVEQSHYGMPYQPELSFCQRLLNF